MLPSLFFLPPSSASRVLVLSPAHASVCWCSHSHSWFVPTLAIFPLLFSVLIFLHPPHLSLVAFCSLSSPPSPFPARPLDSPFSKNSFSSSSYSCLPAPWMGQRHAARWTLLQSCCNGNMLRRLSRRRLFCWPFHLCIVQSFHFFNLLPLHTHTHHQRDHL